MTDIVGGCVTVEGYVSGGDFVSYELVRFSAGKHGVYLTIDNHGVMRPAVGLSEDEATQRVAKMLCDHWGRAYGLALRNAEGMIEGALLKARRAQAEMERWKAAAMKAGIHAKAPKTAKLTEADLLDDDPAEGDAPEAG